MAFNVVTNHSPLGYYNHEDLNRVETATQILAAELSEEGYMASITVKTDWTLTQKPTRSEMSRYLGNVKKCRNNFCVKPETPELPASMDYLTAIGANAIEQNLRDMRELNNNMIAAYHYAGTFYAGSSDTLEGVIT